MMTHCKTTPLEQKKFKFVKANFHLFVERFQVLCNQCDDKYALNPNLSQFIDIYILTGNQSLGHVGYRANNEKSL